jgi:hypothetical protein
VVAVLELVGEYEARRVERMLRDLYVRWLRPSERIAVHAHEEAGWVAMRWELADAERREVYPVEARVELAPQRLRPREAVDLLYDFLGAQMGEYVQGRDPFSGPTWEAVEFAGKQVYVRGQVLRVRAEREADAMIESDAKQRSRAIGPTCDEGHGRDP